MIAEDDDTYRIVYWGYEFGRPRVTADGVPEWGRDLLADPEKIPRRTVALETVDTDDPPWWFPEETPIAPTVTCGNSEKDVSVRDVVTPRGPNPQLESAVLFRDCWEEYR